MKRIAKKIGMSLLTLGLILMTPVMTSEAADGTLQFSDPTGKVGEEITVKVKMDGSGLPIGDGSATLTYDPTMLEFVSGTNATAGDGTISIAASGTGTETELVFELIFKALAEGETVISVNDSVAYLFSDETINLQLGTSTIQIEPGDGTSVNTGSGEREVSASTVEIDGKQYGFYENFTDALIPTGFSKMTIQYNGEEHQALKQDISGIRMVYLIGESGDPVLAIYNESQDSFDITQQVPLGEELNLFILNKEGDKLPKRFQKTTIEFNGMNFPAWQNMEAQDYFLVYALNSQGAEGYYQYDAVDSTYQRYMVQKSEVKAEETDESLFGKIKQFVDTFFVITLISVIVVLAILIVMIIVLSVKLHRRNSELDDLYDEYGIDEDKDVNKKRKKSLNHSYEDTEEYMDNGFSDEDYADEYDGEYLDDEFLEDDNNFYDDEDYDFYDEEEVEVQEQPRKKKRNQESDLYDIDFIDL